MIDAFEDVDFQHWIDNLDDDDIDYFYNLMMNGQIDDVMDAFRSDIEYDDYGEYDDYDRFYDGNDGKIIPHRTMTRLSPELGANANPEQKEQKDLGDMSQVCEKEEEEYCNDPEDKKKECCPIFKDDKYQQRFCRKATIKEWNLLKGTRGLSTCQPKCLVTGEICDKSKPDKCCSGLCKQFKAIGITFKTSYVLDFFQHFQFTKI